MITLLGIDTGGTFTDFVLYREGELRTHKVLSTPAAPEQAILQGLRELGLLEADDLRIVHGSTVATNAVLEGKGVRCVFVTNRGLRDLLAIGRQTRRELYELQPEPVPPPVPRDDCLETGGRLGPDGEILEELRDADLQALGEAIAERAPAAVAIDLLYAWQDDCFERRIADFLAKRFGADLFVSRSSAVLPEFREYERGMATWLNSYVGPLVEGYLRRLQAGAGRAQIAVMQSAGGTIDAAQAGRQAVRMLLSGPAGGLAAARFLGELTGRPKLLTFDMGGTSTDVALVEGDIRLTTEGRIAGWPVAVPMVDMHTIGAGGGSIAFVDSGGLLQVGPESAGADPGPACYGRGGTRPTVTDANLLLGRLRPDAFLGGNMSLDTVAARAAMAPLAAALDMTPLEAAEGIVRIANEHMAHALRVISVQRGIDPRDHTLVSFGGAGGLHVCALAEALGMRRAMVPIHAGVLSALGMLVAPRARELSRSHIVPLATVGEAELAALFAELEEDGRAQLQAEGVAPGHIGITRTVDLRYAGQSWTLNVPWQGIAGSESAFHEHHAARFGHRLDRPVELVNLRVSLRSQHTPPALPTRPAGPPAVPKAHVTLAGFDTAVPVWQRNTLAPGQRIAGPALIVETVSTTWLAPGWTGEMDEYGNLGLIRAEGRGPSGEEHR